MQQYVVWFQGQKLGVLQADSLKVNTGNLVFYNKEDGDWTVVHAVAAGLWDTVERVK